MTNSINEVLAKIKEAQKNPIIDGLFGKAFTESGSATTGLTYYDLQPGALALYPVVTPLRNKIPRVGAGRGIQANWKAITGINVNQLAIGVSEGNRGGVIATTTQDYMAAYRGLGLEDYVTFEADYAADGFDDVKGLAAIGLLRSLMIGEEKVILGGNTSVSLGTTPTPTLADQGTLGSLTHNTTYSVICAALTLDAYLTGSVAGGIRGQVSRTNADTSSDTYGGGTAKLSTHATVTTANDGNDTHSITASVTPVTGAVAYAWFWGASGSEVLGAITTINSVVITATAAGSQTASSLGTADNSTNALVFDGMLSQIVKSGSNSYVSVQATGTAGTGTPLTADGVGGIVEIDAALQHFWDVWRLSPNTIWVSSQEQKNITKKVLAGSQNAALRYVVNADQGIVQGGDLVTSYLNKFCMDGAQSVAVRPHPNLPAGTLLFDTDILPYPLSGVANVLQMRTRRDYYQMTWPIKARKYEYGVYFDGVLQNYFPPAFGIITNIGNG
jgi:hypothetical protein